MPTTRQHVHAGLEVLGLLDTLNLDWLPPLATVQITTTPTGLYVSAQLARQSLTAASGSDQHAATCIADWFDTLTATAGVHDVAIGASRTRDESGGWTNVRVLALIGPDQVPFHVWTHLYLSAAVALGVPDELTPGYSYEPGHLLAAAQLRAFAASVTA